MNKIWILCVTTGVLLVGSQAWCQEAEQPALTQKEFEQCKGVVQQILQAIRSEEFQHTLEDAVTKDLLDAGAPTEAMVEFKKIKNEWLGAVIEGIEERVQDFNRTCLSDYQTCNQRNECRKIAHGLLDDDASIFSVLFQQNS